MRARLIDFHIPDRPEGIVLLLHGGASRRESMRVSPTQLSVLRMIPIAWRVRRAGRGRLIVARLLNSARGWDGSATPVADVGWALGQLAERFGQSLPVCLIGHSLGGRAALLACDQPGVRAAVALNPWLYPTDMVDLPERRRLLFIHGSADRIASPRVSALVARRLAATADVSYVSVDGGKHAMLRRRRMFDGLAARYAAAVLLPDVRPSARLRGILDSRTPVTL